MKKKTIAVTDLLVWAPHCKQICLAKVTVPKILMPAFLKTELNFCQVLSHLLNSCVWGWPWISRFESLFLLFHFCFDRISHDQFISDSPEHTLSTTAGAQTEELAVESAGVYRALDPIPPWGLVKKWVSSTTVSALPLPGCCNYCWELLTSSRVLSSTLKWIIFCNQVEWKHGHTPPAGCSSKPQPFVVLQFCILNVPVQTLSFRELCWMRRAGATT